MTQRQESGAKSTPLAKIAGVLPKPYASTSIEHDSGEVLKRYVPSADAVDAVKRFSSGLAGSKSGRMISITGPYGSGKSTMGVFLSHLVSPEGGPGWKAALKMLRRTSPNVAGRLERARKKADIDKNGMIRCLVTAKREPITVTVLRALDSGATAYFGRYTKRDFAVAPRLHAYTRGIKKGRTPNAAGIIDIISDIARTAPVLIMIDEFGKNIEHFTTDGGDDSDLFLLQELAEMSGSTRRLPLHIVTMQHMSFEEYAIGASAERKKEWAKIQGRFDDMPFANSPEHVRELASRAIDTRNPHAISKWTEKQVKSMQEVVGISPDADITTSCYPLHPLALEALPELCSRYAQNERTLLSFMSGGGASTVAKFIDENVWDGGELPSIGLDTLYDYFITGSASFGQSRLMEIGTIIRDAYGLDDTAARTLKTIGVLNLIGRSGYMRASRRIIEYAVGDGAKSAIDLLLKRSIITYRNHADEYRIWHGTDIDIAAGLDLRRKRYADSSLEQMLRQAIKLDAVVATKHSIETGTMRQFESVFDDGKSEIMVPDPYDGAIIYGTGRPNPPKCNKPVVMVPCHNLPELKRAAIEVTAMRDLLESEDEVINDWVAKHELKERLADAEIVLDGAFNAAYSTNAARSNANGGNPDRIDYAAGQRVSQVCDATYNKTPKIHNEMINRHKITPQAAAARNRLMDAIITSHGKENLGIAGWGPERSVYDAMVRECGIHVQRRNGDGYKLVEPPRDGSVWPAWDAVMDILRKADGRVPLPDIYHICKRPPFGMKDGILPIFVILVMVVHRNHMAVYEHGTYVPRLSADLAERLVKNPGGFEIKHFRNTPSRQKLVSATAVRLGLKPGATMLNIVGHLVTTVNMLPRCIKTTKKLSRRTLAVRNAILDAREPDTLLFESIPNALEIGTLGIAIREEKINTFAKHLTRSANDLQGAFGKVMGQSETKLLNATMAKSKEELARLAAVILPSVSEQKMKVFLGAVAADIPDKESWINYVALTLTDVPPADWKDEHRTMFDNGLLDMADKFKRLVALNLAKVSGLAESTRQVTITDTSGHEDYYLSSGSMPSSPQARKIASKIASDKESGLLTDDDLKDLMAFMGGAIGSKDTKSGDGHS